MSMGARTVLTAPYLRNDNARPRPGARIASEKIGWTKEEGAIFPATIVTGRSELLRSAGLATTYSPKP